jgi:hypothetical protein
LQSSKSAVHGDLWRSASCLTPYGQRHTWG